MSVSLSLILEYLNVIKSTNWFPYFYVENTSLSVVSVRTFVVTVLQDTVRLTSVGTFVFHLVLAKLTEVIVSYCWFSSLLTRTVYPPQGSLSMYDWKHQVAVQTAGASLRCLLILSWTPCRFPRFVYWLRSTAISINNTNIFDAWGSTCQALSKHMLLICLAGNWIRSVKKL